jgi:hypothetical protein
MASVTTRGILSKYDDRAKTAETLESPFFHPHEA